MSATDADCITRTEAAPVRKTDFNDIVFGSRGVVLDHRAFWIEDAEDETSVCIPYVDLPSFMEALVQSGLIAGWTPKEQPTGRRCLMCGLRGEHSEGCGNEGWR